MIKSFAYLKSLSPSAIYDNKSAVGRRHIQTRLATNLSGITRQCSSPTTAGAHNRINKIFFCTSPPTWPTCKSRISRMRYRSTAASRVHIMLKFQEITHSPGQSCGSQLIETFVEDSHNVISASWQSRVLYI